MGFHPYDDRPHHIAGAPAEEGISEADAFERIDLDPEDQPNFTEDEPDDD